MARNLPNQTADAAATAVWIGNAILMLLIIAFAVSWAYVMNGPAPSISARQTEQFADAVKDRLAEHSDVILAEASSLASEALPPLGEAIYRQARADLPRYLGEVREQGDAFVDHMSDVFVVQVKNRYGDFFRAQRQVLAEEFPEHASDEKVDQLVEDFEQTGEKIAQRYYVPEFRAQAKRTLALWDAIPPAPQPGAGDPSLETQLAEYLGDWTVLTLAESAEDQLAVR